MYRFLNSGLEAYDPLKPESTTPKVPEKITLDYVLSCIAAVVVFLVFAVGGVGGFFTFIIITIGALVDTNKDEVRTVCEGDAWTVLLLELLIPWAVMLTGSVCICCSEKHVMQFFVGWFILCYGIFSGVMFLGVVQTETRKMQNDVMCMDVLRAHSLGMNRALLVDLLAFFYIINAIGFYGALIILCFSLFVMFCGNHVW